jgi:inhibitor of KinA sporulation pathway (predicted exonuclease)
MSLFFMYIFFIWLYCSVMDVLIDNKIIELNCYVDPNHDPILFSSCSTFRLIFQKSKTVGATSVEGTAYLLEYSAYCEIHVA